MDFKRYPSIESSHREKFLKKIKEEGHDKEIFVVQEKIHGSNFSIYINDLEIKYAKRSAFLGRGSDFFDYQTVTDHYVNSFVKLFNYLKESGGVSEIVICGELYGGTYPHKDVPKTDHKAVQKGVYYSPTEDFIAFDLNIDGRFIGVLEANNLFNMFNIPFAETLFKGSLDDCLKFPNEFQTTIPDLKGLPSIEDNICEGVVIRPLMPIFLWSRERLILKNKNDRFKEINGENEKRQSKPREHDPIDPIVSDLLDKANKYINENRLKNTLSKIGNVDNSAFSKIMGLFTADIIEEFQKDEIDTFSLLDKAQQKQITKMIGQSAALLLRKNFVNILDGEF